MLPPAPPTPSEPSHSHGGPAGARAPGAVARFARGLFTTQMDKSGGRLRLLMLFFVLAFGAAAGRLTLLGLSADDAITTAKISRGEVSTARPLILDRNGEILATDIVSMGLYAEPKHIIDRDEAAELINSVLPDLNGRELRDKLGSGRGFIWLKREVTPRQQEAIHRLGIPGVGFMPGNKRVYPNGPIGAHVIGFANTDNTGIAGIEKWIDTQGLNDLKSLGFIREGAALQPIQLSLDIRVTHAMREELQKGLTHYKAKAAAGAIMDVNTGEVISLVSLPDYDPNNPVDALKPENINRIAVGVYEMGSTFKALNTAMALDSGKVNINSSFDTRGTLRYGRSVVHEYHPTNRVLTVPEIFIHSSNIGSAKMALTVGMEGQKQFLRKMGQFDRLVTELPENAQPLLPLRWGELSTVTIAFGHGIAVAPLQAMMAVSALVNGGTQIKPTFVKKPANEPVAVGPRLIKPETSEALRFIMRLNAEKGSAGKANIPGYFAGGKTGTANKVIHGRYANNVVFTTFMMAVPADKPRYLFLVTMDEPQGLAETYGFRTAAWNSGNVSGKILERVGPMLDITPRFDNPVAPFPLMARLGAWGSK